MSLVGSPLIWEWHYLPLKKCHGLCPTIQSAHVEPLFHTRPQATINNGTFKKCQ